MRSILVAVSLEMGLRERMSQSWAKSRNGERGLTRLDRRIHESAIPFPLHPDPPGVFPVSWMTLVNFMQRSKAQPARSLRDILTQWMPNGL